MAWSYLTEVVDGDDPGVASRGGVQEHVRLAAGAGDGEAAPLPGHHAVGPGQRDRHPLALAVLHGADVVAAGDGRSAPEGDVAGVLQHRVDVEGDDVLLVEPAAFTV